MPTDRPALRALTGLRFPAALSVVLCHFGESGMAPVPSRLVAFLDGGRTAVALFFVLSGFILAYNYPRLTGRTGRWRFYVARLARVYPMVLLGAAVGAIGMVHAWRHPGLLEPWFALTSSGPGAPAVSLAAQLTMTTGWFPFSSINQPWNGPAWSIACEAFFYALFPVLIAAARRWSVRWVVVTAAALWLLQGLWIAALDRFVPENRSGFVIEQFPLTHFADFVLGIATWRLLAVRIDSGRTIGRVPRLAMLVAVVLGLAALALMGSDVAAYWPMTPLFAALVGLLAISSPARSWLACAPLVLLGEASFSLYLLHLPLLRAAQAAGVPGGSVGTLLLVGVVGLSIPVFLLYETPIRRAIRRRAG